MAAPQPLTLGALLRRFRLAAGLTQEELAEKASLSVNAISAIERGDAYFLLGRWDEALADLDQAVKFDPS
ncbi:MAG TPA: helix-turn-helix domain-containing protein, partial [Ktedonobacterales bacterium]|nr:helix-turn-helix domain-containing protein [Ktedonobacterales bacterium]